MFVFQNCACLFLLCIILVVKVGLTRLKEYYTKRRTLNEERVCSFLILLLFMHKWLERRAVWTLADDQRHWGESHTHTHTKTKREQNKRPSIYKRLVLADWSDACFDSLPHSHAPLFPRTIVLFVSILDFFVVVKLIAIRRFSTGGRLFHLERMLMPVLVMLITQQ